MDSTFALRLLTQVEKRIDERRLKVAATLLAYLEDPSFLEQEDLILSYGSKYDIAKLARDMWLRLFQVKKPTPAIESPVSDMEDAPDGVESESIDSPPPKSDSHPPTKSDSNDFKDKMEVKKAKRKKRGPTSGLSSTSLLTAIKQDMKEYEVTGERSEKLDKVRMRS